MEIETLISIAMDARKNAYIPYSGYAVGAALLCKNGKVYSGCNIENASYGATNCAERTAIFKAVSEGERDFSMIAIVGGKREDDCIKDYAYPCGICRQVMSEFTDSDSFRVIVAKSENDYETYTLSELLAYGFGNKNLT